MPRPCSIHCVMPSECRRAPGLAHHPAFRPVAAATALAIAGTMLVLASPGASAATHASPGWRAASGTGPPSPARRLLDPAPASRPNVRSAARKRTVPPRDAPPDLPSSQRLDQQFAEYALRASGIGWRSTGRCSDRTVRTCTSFEGIRWGTIRSLIEFAESSGCEVTVTGGTEHGHAGGTYSHANGYKIDIATGSCVDEAVRRYPFTGVRGDGARLHRSPEGVVFAREKDHWDITIRRGPRG
ncbi:hypothetical protein [Actinomadura mexicana]|uniref:Uncharacterized protein n=1 Tax=Actinomadura mexicana TaxID=134959 RepID=A0A238VX82_9ACTN|nr:hypothetical protein [Actinomadura mexicana]SNR38945.1 hypothetical protein SAMN06265355_102496 [Actinomadura mexicana]